MNLLCLDYLKKSIFKLRQNGDFSRRKCFFIKDIKWCCRLGILMQNVGQVSMTLDLSWRQCWKQQNLTSICLLVSLKITTRTTTLQGNILNLKWPKLIQLSAPNDNILIMFSTNCLRRRDVDPTWFFIRTSFTYRGKTRTIY